jgi:hypothetical protein
MEIGKERRIVRVEPIEDPLPRETPAPSPEKAPAEPLESPEREPIPA